ncbi:hypothetical protein Mgra_00005130, partial [Meloidogyne graminicola]
MDRGGRKEASGGFFLILGRINFKFLKK